MLHPPVTDQAYLQQLLSKHGVRPVRSAGQNFLISSEVVEAIVAVTTPGPNLVTELGAGVGPVTLPLLAANKEIRAIERDQVLAQILSDQVPRRLVDRLTLVIDDLKNVDWWWDAPYQIVGNIPYNLSGWIIRRLTQLPTPPVQVILLVQHEVGQRLAAAPPDYHLLSLVVQLWAEVTPLVSVPASCFWPAPQVASQLVLLTPHVPTTDPGTREAIVGLAKPAFQQRRKQLKNTLGTALGLSTAQVEEHLHNVGVLPTARPQEVSREQWMQLYTNLKALLPKP